MTRWSILAVALTIIACKDKEKADLSRDASEATPTVDSALQSDSAVADSAAAAGARAQGSVRADTARAGGAKIRPATRADTAARPTGANAGETQGPSGAEAMGGVRTGRDTTSRRSK